MNQILDLVSVCLRIKDFTENTENNLVNENGLTDQRTINVFSL